MYPMPPQTVGHYTIEHELGRGQNGTVYLARDMRLERRVAIKVLNRSDEHAWADTLQEARLASCLDHRYICTIYDVGEVEADGEDLPYIAMEYVDGPSLLERLENGPLEPTLLLRFAAQLCEALAYAHEHGVIHRDVKASNVLISPDAEAKFVDFGSAARSPRAGPVSAQGDLWAFGTLLYQMATGEDPPSPTLAGSPGKLKVPRSVPRGLATIIERCMDTDLARGYHNASEVLRDLRTESDHPDSLPRKQSLKRQPLLFVALGLVVAVALFIIGFGIPPHLRPSERPSSSNAQPYSPPRAAMPGARTQMREGGRPDIKVWVNSRTMKYHCPDSPWYGRTLTGQYLTQKEAQKVGYVPAYGAVCP
jgi:serine/threonine-protein kinase